MMMMIVFSAGFGNKTGLAASGVILRTLDPNGMPGKKKLGDEEENAAKNGRLERLVGRFARQQGRQPPALWRCQLTCVRRERLEKDQGE